MTEVVGASYTISASIGFPSTLSAAEQGELRAAVADISGANIGIAQVDPRNTWLCFGLFVLLGETGLVDAPKLTDVCQLQDSQPTRARQSLDTPVHITCSPCLIP